MTARHGSSTADTRVELGAIIGTVQVEIGVTDGDGDGLAHFGLSRCGRKQRSRNGGCRKLLHLGVLLHRIVPVTAA
ncbi:hypothetical protein NS355_10410 [Sphingomonas yabuuchiae]|uniref:Uncharacterized protein n=1 Tax=Sphingomonas yabuuchiae TaxID=172044 RepID=A0A147IR24_9SPHN|nr:hypothetical protein NS355_10410 [Sphingomonas yabuuchiae]